MKHLLLCTLLISVFVLVAGRGSTAVDKAAPSSMPIERGLLPAGKEVGSMPIEVKGYLVQVNFDLSTTRIPTSYTILFQSDPAIPAGIFWMNRTPEAIETTTRLMDDAFAHGKRVWYDPSLDALGVGIAPDKALVGPKNVIPSP